MSLALPGENVSPESTSDKSVAWPQRLRNLHIPRNLGLMAMIAIAVAAGLGAFFWAQKPQMTALYTGLDAKATAEATDLLRTAQIPFELDAASGAIRVPEKYIHDARLKLASSGLTDSGRLGFELMERDPGFGVSQFIENARYQHALETELARTITALRPVRDARVHLAIPRPSAFTRQREVSSASVVLELRGGQPLERGQVDAIVHMVASSIPDLAPERVTVLDQAGRLLSLTDPNSDSALHAMQFDQVRRLESTLNQRIRELLEPMTGANRVNPEVSVEMDFSVTEEARELYNGQPQKLRSEQLSENTRSNEGPQGVPGTVSNTPPGAEALPEAANAPRDISKTATRNYELDRTVQHTRQPAGRVQRLSVAVLVDHIPRADTEGNLSNQPLTDAELTRMEDLVKQAVGFNAERGDTVSIMNAPFVHEMMPLESPKWWQTPQAHEALRWLLGAIVILALLFGVLRPALQQLLGPPSVTPENVPPSAEIKLLDEDVVANESTNTQTEAPPLALPVDSHEASLRLAREAVKADSGRVAQVVRGWIADE